MAKRKRTKRKLTSEQIAKMQEGRKKARIYKERVRQARDLEDKALGRGKYRR